MIKIAIIMDPIEQLNPAKDTTLAIMHEAGQKNCKLYYGTDAHVWMENGIVMADMHPVTVDVDQTPCYHLSEPVRMLLSEFDVVLMRKDPPFDMQYIYMTYLLELAASQGVWVINNPASVRDANEKLYAAWFPECCPATLVSANKKNINEFISTYQHVVIKPLDLMGGRSIFQLMINDPKNETIIDDMTNSGTKMVMVQQFLADIVLGDKRIILIDGVACDIGLVRVPKEGSFLGNLSAGASYHLAPLTERDRWIVAHVGPTLQAKGLVFTGIDVIGGYLTEINVTSPTGVCEIAKLSSINVSSYLVDFIVNKVKSQ